jgi:hypothetical protein
MADPRFLVHTRDGCALCDDFIAELAALLEPRQEAFGLRDVDAARLSPRARAAIIGPIPGPARPATGRPAPP